MTTPKRERSVNFSREEVELLTSLVDQHKSSNQEIVFTQNVEMTETDAEYKCIQSVDADTKHRTTAKRMIRKFKRLADAKLEVIDLQKKIKKEELLHKRKQWALEEEEREHKREMWALERKYFLNKYEK